MAGRSPFAGGPLFGAGTRTGPAARFFQGPVKDALGSLFGKGPSAPSAPSASAYYSGPGANWGDTSSWVRTGSGPQGGGNAWSGSGAALNAAAGGPFLGFTPGQPGPQSQGYVPAGATVQGDAQGRSAQMDALRQLQGLSRTGWSQTDQAAMGAAQRQANLAEQSQRQAIMQQAAARGQASGGASLLGALVAQQGAANRSADVAAQMGAEGANRRFAAAQSAATLGGQINDQTFAQQQARAQAIDAFNQLATQNQANAVSAGAGNAQQAWNNETTRRNNQYNRIAGVFGNILGG